FIPYPSKGIKECIKAAVDAVEAFKRYSDKEESMIFVFGSNFSGIHGAGAAKYALKHKGAIWGQGVGLQGGSYAIPTKDRNIETLPLDVIEFYVAEFIIFAGNHPEMQFEITPIGCGLAGYSRRDIWPMFKGVPSNCFFSHTWNE